MAGRFGEALLLDQPEDLVLSKGDKRGSRVAYRWTRSVPIMVRAMALAGETLWVAGPDDLIDEEAAFQSFADEATQEKLALQNAALQGKRGARLQAIDAATGETLAEYALESPPVFDGLIVAAGRVLVATVDGRLRSFVPAKAQP